VQSDQTSRQRLHQSGYDNAGRRATRTLPGQAVANYTFDNANRLTQITQGSTTVQFGYDANGRRTSLTLPNGIVVTYNYDSKSQLLAMTYALGSNALGNLNYSYDTAGHRTGVGGSFARTGLPLAVTATGYNANNQLTSWGILTCCRFARRWKIHLVCEAAPKGCPVVICFASYIGSSSVLELSTNRKSAPFPAR
jgi:YD repeat-containing protein